MSDLVAHAADEEEDEELPAWSLPAHAVDRISISDEWPEQVTREWALGGSTGKGVRVCILDSGVEFDHPQVGKVDGAVAISLGEDDEIVGRLDHVVHHSSRSRRTAS